jgi:hypothetical protein
MFQLVTDETKSQEGKPISRRPVTGMSTMLTYSVCPSRLLTSAAPLGSRASVGQDNWATAHSVEGEGAPGGPGGRHFRAEGTSEFLSRNSGFLKNSLGKCTICIDAASEVWYNIYVD